ncbi:unnamed protein product [Orchesella dallaii]|uniref:Uncharacterized protein n=1 Tax=Orchesella dallaii TaxID=48710 RepID=A0ABP1S7D8_9HEXA
MTLNAIYNSKYGNSEQALFFIFLESFTTNNDQIQMFANLSQFSSFVFHASIVFTSVNSTILGVHCYFCPPNPTRIRLPNTKSFQSLSGLRKYSQHLNGHGYGRHTLIRSAIGKINYIRNCLKIDYSLEKSNWHNLYKELRKHCSPPQPIQYAIIGQVLNTTISITQTDIPDEELNDAACMVHTSSIWRIIGSANAK